MIVFIDCQEAVVSDALAAGARIAGAASMKWPTPSGAWPASDQFLLFTDASISRLTQYAADMRVSQHDPKRSIVRMLDRQHTGWVYHDLPAFASIIAPRTEEAALAAIRRLSRARLPATRDNDALHDDRDLAPPVLPHAFQPTLHDEPMRLARLAAGNDLKVLLVGETGTGKNTFAKRIHQLSGRPGPFVSVNCAELPETLIESELFGVEPGAFTGAKRARPGRFEMADQGTLFIDEIDSMPVHLQAKLLSAIQDGGTTRLGDHRFRPARFRLITATQTPLRELVEANRFRADLMHRVSVIEIALPPIRLLGSALVTAFEEVLASERRRLGLPDTAIEPSVYATLLSHDWPGNFRELTAAAQRYAVGLSPLPATATHAAAAQPLPGLRAQLSEIERALVSRALTAHEGDLRATSRALCLPLETLRYRMRLLGLNAGSSRPSRAVPEHTASTTVA